MEITTEMEDGDAYYQSSYGDNSTIDPDICFSYIDEKIENVLGDCRKDFENPLTPDSLGAKFGMYGSFLPTYQRSPIVPHPKTQHVSPNNIPIEVGQQNIGSQSSASKPSTNVKSNPEVPESCVDKSTRNGQPSVNNFNKDSDQKSLKVRIRVGSDNLSKSKKAEIYSGLGLDISPSSSLEASPVNSNGFFQVPQDNQIESPTSILEIMTSFPVMGKLVSPLPYDVLHLMEKEKGSQESSVTALHGSDFNKVDQDFLEDFSKLPTKVKSDEKKEVLPIKTDSDISTGSKILDNGVMKSSKQKDVKLGPNKTTSSSLGAKKKLNDVIMDNGVKNKADMPKEDLKIKSGKVMETYKDLFGDLDLGHEDDEKIGLKKASGGNNGITGKKEEKRVVSDVGVPMVAPLVNEDWVCCDKCEQWRLLPPGINPSNLPEKWLCSMLDWLPEMNKCSFSEEETTKAITSKLGTIPHNGPHQHVSSFGVKKKQGVKDLRNEVKQDKPSMSSNSSKKILHNSYKSRSLNGTKPSPLNGIEFQDSGQSRRVVVEKEGKKQKDDNGLHQKLDESNNNRHSKIGNKRESTQDFPKDLKKVKTGVDHGTFHMGKLDKEDIAKKRKRENEVDVTPKYVKEKSENNHIKEKGPKMLKSKDEGIDTKKGKRIEEVKMRSINVIDSSRKDKDTAMAATSSSSKVSSSHKVKTNNQETKVSPVGSISSSPRQILKNNKGVDPLKKIVNTRRYEEKPKEGRNKSQGKFPSENPKTHGELKRRHHDDNTHVKVDQESKRPKKDVSSHVKVDQESKRPKKEVIGKEKLKSIPPRGQSEKVQGGDNVVLKNNKKVEDKKGNDGMNIKNQARDTRDTYKGKEPDGTVVLVRELTNQATTNALREATNMKHTADRLKNTGSIIESRALYMEAALKFLHVASVFESVHKETGRYGELIQSISIYRDTAKLCEYCANEYERTKEMTTTALAYKCMEVAFMKVIFSSNTTAIKDVNELKSSLPMGPTGESPSSSASASDLDNLNCKAAIAKDVKNPKVAGNHVIAARHKPNYTRILDFAQDVNSAMEASRKSRIAFAASDLKDNAASSAIKSALDFNFHDVEGLLHRVRLAMEVING